MSFLIYILLTPACYAHLSLMSCRDVITELALVYVVGDQEML